MALGADRCVKRPYGPGCQIAAVLIRIACAVRDGFQALKIAVVDEALADDHQSIFIGDAFGNAGDRLCVVRDILADLPISAR